MNKAVAMIIISIIGAIIAQYFHVQTAQRKLMAAKQQNELLESKKKAAEEEAAKLKAEKELEIAKNAQFKHEQNETAGPQDLLIRSGGPLIRIDDPGYVSGKFNKQSIVSKEGNHEWNFPNYTITAMTASLFNTSEKGVLYNVKNNALTLTFDSEDFNLGKDSYAEIRNKAAKNYLDFFGYTSCFGSMGYPTYTEVYYGPGVKYTTTIYGNYEKDKIFEDICKFEELNNDHIEKATKIARGEDYTNERFESVNKGLLTITKDLVPKELFISGTVYNDPISHND